MSYFLTSPSTRTFPHQRPPPAIPPQQDHGSHTSGVPWLGVAVPACPVLISSAVLDAHQMCCQISAEQQTEGSAQLRQEEEEGEEEGEGKGVEEGEGKGVEEGEEKGKLTFLFHQSRPSHLLP